MKIGLYFRIGSGLDVIRSHLFLIPTEIGKLFLHILLFESLLLLLNIDLHKDTVTSSCFFTFNSLTYLSLSKPSYFFYDYSS